MALAIRLRQQGRNNHAVYRVVVMDERARRDGKYLEALGWYNPYETEIERSLAIKADRIQHWLSLGAQMTESVECLVQKVAPSVVRWKTERTLAQLAKKRDKRKARKEAPSA
ncbi:MAG: 30S ribosomal protein S16 [Parachlamydiaceae bacterium]|nr:30S ribosomal protein S16 [Parachlamydiaceae bacterium]